MAQFVSDFANPAYLFGLALSWCAVPFKPWLDFFFWSRLALLALVLQLAIFGNQWALTIPPSFLSELLDLFGQLLNPRFFLCTLAGLDYNFLEVSSYFLCLLCAFAWHIALTKDLLHFLCDDFLELRPLWQLHLFLHDSFDCLPSGIWIIWKCFWDTFGKFSHDGLPYRLAQVGEHS